MFSSNKQFRYATLCEDGTVEWEETKVGLWWKDDFSGYHFAPFDERQAKVSAIKKSEFRLAVSANVSEFRNRKC